MTTYEQLAAEPDAQARLVQLLHMEGLILDTLRLYRDDVVDADKAINLIDQIVQQAGTLK